MGLQRYGQFLKLFQDALDQTLHDLIAQPRATWQLLFAASPFRKNSVDHSFHHSAPQFVVDLRARHVGNARCIPGLKNRTGEVRLKLPLQFFFGLFLF